MSPRSTTSPRFLDAGEAALVVEFGTVVDPAVSDRVLCLDEILAASQIDGIRELVPTYRSLMIHYDPLRIRRETLISTVEDKLMAAPSHRRESTHWIVPCCYEEPHGEDLAELAAIAGLPPADVAALHGGATYRVYMYGFAPGFTYLGGLPEALAVSRRSTPRPPHEPKAVTIGGGLSAIGTFSMPTGWYVVGRTPEKFYAPERSRAFLLEPGDTLRFEPIDSTTFDGLHARAEAGEMVARTDKL